jgi:hypothetical protein
MQPSLFAPRPPVRAGAPPVTADCHGTHHRESTPSRFREHVPQFAGTSWARSSWLAIRAGTNRVQARAAADQIVSLW